MIFQKQMLVAQSEKKKMETAKSMDRYENEYIIEKDTFFLLKLTNNEVYEIVH